MDVFGANYLTVDLNQKFGLGDTYFDKNAEATFQYARASEAISAFAIAKLNNDGTAVGLTTTVSGAIPTLAGIPQVAIPLNSHGWFFVEGAGTGKGIKVLALTLCAVDAKLYTTATATPNCAIDDTATDLVQGLVLTATNAAGGTVATECRAVCRIVTNCQD